MIGLDTNVVVRYIMQDDASQSAKATELIESLSDDRPGFISLVSIVEIYWVLTACYRLTDAQFKEALEILLRARQIVIDRVEQVAAAARLFDPGRADFADCLIARIAASRGCRQTLTFDVKAARHAGMTLLE
jgi:predicted nucleic-acid-binding protein